MSWLFGGRPNPHRPPENYPQHANHQRQPSPEHVADPHQHRPQPANQEYHMPRPAEQHAPQVQYAGYRPQPAAQAPQMQYAGSAFGAAAPGGTLSFQQANAPKLKYPELDRIHFNLAASRGIDPAVLSSLEVLKSDIRAYRASFRPFDITVELRIVEEAQMSMEREKALEEKRKKEAAAKKKREEEAAAKKREEEEAAAKRKAAMEEERKRRENEEQKRKQEEVKECGTMEAGPGSNAGGTSTLSANIPVFDFTGDDSDNDAPPPPPPADDHPFPSDRTGTPPPPPPLNDGGTPPPSHPSPSALPPAMPTPYHPPPAPPVGASFPPEASPNPEGLKPPGAAFSMAPERDRGQEAVRELVAAGMAAADARQVVEILGPEDPARARAACQAMQELRDEGHDRSREDWNHWLLVRYFK